MAPKISEHEKEQRRGLIIQSACEVFKRKGYVNATMQDIVDETGMSRGWVYLYYSSKEEIMQAILAENEKEMIHQFNQLKAAGLSIWQGLSGIIDAMELQFDDTSDELPIVIYEYFISGWKDEERRTMLEEHYRIQHEHLLQFLQMGVENGEFHPQVDLDVINKMVTSYFEGLLLHTKAAGIKTVRLKEQLQIFKSVLKELLQVNDLEGKP